MKCLQCLICSLLGVILDDLVNLIWNDPGIFMSGDLEKKIHTDVMVSILSLDDSSSEEQSHSDVESAIPNPKRGAAETDEYNDNAATDRHTYNARAILAWMESN